MAALGVRKRARPWGTVYDSITKQPLDPAVVVLYDLNGREITTSITDLDGRFGFLVQPGVYKVVPHKTNYTFASEKLSGKSRDELYHDLYFGDYFEVKEESQVIARNLPMDPVKFDWNEFAKNKQKLMKFYSRRDRILARVTTIFFFFGFFVALAAVLSIPKTYNIVIFSLYLVLVFIRRVGLKTRAFGQVTDSEGNPLSFSLIKVFSADLKNQITQRATDKYGRYFCLVPNGSYCVTIERKLEDGSYTQIFASEPISINAGIIKKDFKVGLPIELPANDSSAKLGE
ncbi:hypothetical protein A3B93_00420 [Candidatus Nomurabacteria bacterium RIFCSPHIGHO2_02_FULL_42_24]|nr:MAG: hypothetical protein A3B93_00420 [Candidatus Nomurabacteria bacterium RIFCSPHIGHO2_02_FULL_42_24]